MTNALQTPAKPAVIERYVISSGKSNLSIKTQNQWKLIFIISNRQVVMCTNINKINENNHKMPIIAKLSFGA